MFQILEKNAEVELDRLSRSLKQQIDQMQSNHLADLRALDRRLRSDQVIQLLLIYHFEMHSVYNLCYCCTVLFLLSN